MLVCIPLNHMQFSSLHPEQKRPGGIIKGLEQFLRVGKPNRILWLGDGRNILIVNKLGTFSNNRNQLGLQISNQPLGLKWKEDCVCIYVEFIALEILEENITNAFRNI